MHPHPCTSKVRRGAGNRIVEGGRRGVLTDAVGHDAGASGVVEAAHEGVKHRLRPGLRAYHRGSGSQPSRSPCMASTQSEAVSRCSSCAPNSTPTFLAEAEVPTVTRFHPALPPLMWSNDATKTREVAGLGAGGGAARHQFDTVCAHRQPAIADREDPEIQPLRCDRTHEIRSGCLNLFHGRPYPLLAFTTPPTWHIATSPGGASTQFVYLHQTYMSSGVEEAPVGATAPKSVPLCSIARGVNGENDGDRPPTLPV